MTNEDRDKLAIETHGAVMIVVKELKEVRGTLYGNGKPGAVADIILLNERQEQCPARKANSMESKRLTIATIVMAVSIISAVASIAFALHGK